MKTKKEIMFQNRIKPEDVSGFRNHAEKPLLIIKFHKGPDRYFKNTDGGELNALEVRFDTWTGDDVGPAFSGQAKEDKMAKKVKQRKKPKRIEKDKTK